MKTKILVMVLLSSIGLLAQAKAPVKEEVKAPETKTIPQQYSAEDKLELRNAETNTLQAYGEFQRLSALAAQTQIQATQVQQTFLQQQAQQQELWKNLAKKYKLDEKTEVICDGPGEGPCKDVKRNDIVRKEKK